MYQYKLILFTIALLLIGCIKKPPIIPPESELDNPAYHFLQGMAAFEKDNILLAESSFTRAVGIDPKFGDGYAGLALLYAGMGQISKSEVFLKRAFSIQNRTAQMYLIKGRILTRHKSEKKWLEKAIDSFKEAEDLDANIFEVNYYQGEAYRAAKKYELAANAYREVIAGKGRLSESANENYRKMQILMRVSPGSKVGETIAVMDKLTRADLAALLATEFKIEKVYERFGIHHYDLTYSAYEEEEFKLPEDVIGNWASGWISVILELGVMEPYPDGLFKPKQELKRFEYARAIQSILINLQKDPSLARKYLGEKSRFPDVSPDHFAYNAMALAAERGIITPEKINGVYNPTGSVSGLEALEIIRIFQEKLTIQF